MSKTVTMILGIVVILLLACGFVLLIYWKGLSKAILLYCFKRTAPERWSRKCSDTSDKRLFKMWNEGEAWAEENKGSLNELEITNGNLSLSAQHFDFGYEKTIIMVPGMYETSSYLYYYAGTFKDLGYNCLLIDNRTSGKSDGAFITLGLEESGDILQWANVLYDRFKIKEILLFGVRSGAVYAMAALKEASCPAYIKGMISDSAYFRFTDFFKNYMVSKKYNTKVLKSVMNKVKASTGADPASECPENYVDKIDVPILFLASESDTLTDKDQTQEMFEKCGTSCGNTNKKIIWFSDAEGSFLRLSNPQKYDSAILDFTDIL